MLKLLFLMLFPVLAFAATQGSPEPTFPGPSPSLWVDFGNDNLVPNQPDDRLTASWSFGARDEDWILGGTYGMLTSQSTGTRQDELTCMLGLMLIDEAGYRFSCSGGFRNYHNIDGQAIQNSAHKRMGDPHMNLTYDRNICTGICLFDFRQTRMYQVGDRIMGYFWALQDGMTSEANEIEIWGGPAIDITNFGDAARSYMWVGAGFRSYNGGFYGPTDEAVQKAYQGFSFRGGLRLQNLTTSLTVGTHAAFATIGLCL